MTMLPAANSRLAIGLTGGIGSGKSTVADLFAERGASIVDTDQIAHQLTARGGIAIDAIRSQFGDAFISPAGAMDRAKMRALVFSDAAAKERLEAILHPLIRNVTEQAAMAATGRYVMFVVPLLVESGAWRERVARIVAIDCPEHLQVERVMRRNGLSEVQVRAIMMTQVSREMRLAAADEIIVNDGTAADLIPQVDRLHAEFCALADELAANPSQSL